MKKFNLLLMATLVAFGFLFTSCKDDEATVLEISLENAAIASGASLTGSITATAGLETVKVLTVTAIGETSILVITDFNVLPVLKTADGLYTILVPPSILTVDGTYKITAIDKDGQETSKNFTVGSGTFGIPGTLTSIATGVTLASVQPEPSTNISCCASASGAAYTSADAKPLASTIDFVYFNGNGTIEANNTIYSPNSASTSPVGVSVSGVFTSWTTKNITAFAKVTSKTGVAVATALTSPSAKVTVANGDMVAFKTAGNAYGVLTVTGVGAADTWGGNSTITVTIELFQ